ncbi:DUF6247 family protein [Nocardia otitidiscaviarum]|uniref:DUF6247 family protein n=1 Tax=Nocardia otitidiscaviarum TaxID=1823 RepID=UPI001892FC12|nr:DUF6247 family protein [Nocardia otitidiscaviarum]MBF6239935.1 hypothetical protein [Nocardia otitidiscaviarum]
MASPAPLPRPSQVPAAEPEALRSVLSAALREEFDAEWEVALERAKQSHSLAGIRSLLNKWQHTAVMEQRDPGSYRRMLDKAADIEAAGGRASAISVDDLRALIARRLQAG